MKWAIDSLEALFASIPLPMLEVWGRLGYLLAFGVMLCAFSGLTFRPGGHWGLGIERQSWDARALQSILLTLVMIVVTGYLGSFIVLVPGAQTFESLKDLSVFLCIVLFGYPALITVPFAYGISDLIEGVPPSYLLDWIFGYFINPACFWVAYQFIGKRPDFTQARTWAWYAFFVAIFMSTEPVLWGYICSTQFTSVISYGKITPALYFTTIITWTLAPFAMLLAYPLARKTGFFWAEIRRHVRERRLGSKEWLWESGAAGEPAAASSLMRDAPRGIPIRMLIVTPFIVLVMLMIGATAYVVLHNAEAEANRLASRLHQEIADNINLQLDDYLERNALPDATRANDISKLLRKLPITQHGRAFVIDHDGHVIASSSDPASPDYPQPGTQAAASNDPVIRNALQALVGQVQQLSTLKQNLLFRFDIVTATPLSRETWLTQATVYQDRLGGHADWILMTAIPASYYLEGVRNGNSQTAMISAFALMLALAIAGLLAAMVTAPISRLARATRSLARGELPQGVADSPLSELSSLSDSFNHMAEQLTNYRHRMQLATRALNLGIWDWNVSTNELIWDEQMYELYGIGKDDFSSTFDAWENCVLPEDLAAAKAEIEAALRGEREFNSEFRITWPDGRVRYIASASQVFRAPDGQPLRMVGANFDITARRLAEQQVHKLNADLEARVYARTQQLEQANRALAEARDAAESATRAKSEFLANMSHELRTPLNAILGFSDMLRHRQELDAASKHSLTIIHKSGDHLLGLINNVLDIAKIEAGRMALEEAPFDLGAMLMDIIDMLSVRAAEKGLYLTLDPASQFPRYIVGDQAKLRQVMINLISNALSATGQGGVTLRLHHAADTQDQLVMEVEDSGCGIAEAQQTRLFNAFVQVDARGHNEGTGLGLAISRQIVELMGGAIQLRSAVGQGSTFSVQIPLRLARREEIQITSASDGEAVGLMPGQPAYRVLVVDDQFENQLLMARLLERVGFIVSVADSGAAALRLYEQERPDFIWMDRRMPLMDGIEATRRIRAMPGGDSVKIAAITASTFHEDDAQLNSSGFDAILHKPYRAAQLYACMSDLLGVRYAYASPPDASPAPASELSPAAFHALDAAHRQSFLEAFSTLNKERILAAIDPIAQADAVLAATLRRMVDDLEYARIWKALEPAA